MADDNAKLASCPHCGKEDTFVERSDYSACHVVCNECGARGPVRCDETEADAAAYENGEAEPGEMAARRAWNTRPAPPAMDREAVDTVAFVQEWMMSGDHEPDRWHRDFAAAIDARTASPDPMKLAERFCATPLPETVSADLCATQPGAGRYGANLMTVAEATVVLRAALSTLSADAIRQGEGVTEVAFEVWQDDEPVAGSTNEADARHYLEVYGQDGPAKLMRVVTVRSEIAATPASHASDGRKA